MQFRDIIELAKKRNLTEAEAAFAMEQMADGVPPAAEIAELLRTPALSPEGVDAPTLIGLARVVRQRAVPVPECHDHTLFDTCGTGGGVATFNISTAAAFCFAAARERLGELPKSAALLEQVSVAKHGNRAVASHCGSADCLEACGVKIDLPPDKVVESIKRFGFGFFFAQTYHRAFAHVQPVRKLLKDEGRRTAFNLIGPLANPAQLPCQVLGVFMPEKRRVMAEVLRALGVQRALSLTGRTETGAIMDEISLSGPTEITQLENGELRELTLTPEDFGFHPAPVSTVQVSSRAESIAMMQAVLNGQAAGSPAEHAVVINVAAALHLAGAGGWQESASLARDIIASGRPAAILRQVAEFSHAT